MSRPSEKAVEYSATITQHQGQRDEVRTIITAAHDQALGLERSVCLRTLRDGFAGQPVDDEQLALFIAETLQRERQCTINDVVKMLDESGDLYLEGASRVVRSKFGGDT